MENKEKNELNNTQKLMGKLLKKYSETNFKKDIAKTIAKIGSIIGISAFSLIMAAVFSLFTINPEILFVMAGIGASVAMVSQFMWWNFENMANNIKKDYYNLVDIDKKYNEISKEYQEIDKIRIELEKNFSEIKLLNLDLGEMYSSILGELLNENRVLEKTPEEIKKYKKEINEKIKLIESKNAITKTKIDKLEEISKNINIKISEYKKLLIEGDIEREYIITDKFINCQKTIDNCKKMYNSLGETYVRHKISDTQIAREKVSEEKQNILKL